MHSPLARSGFSQITRRCGTSLGRGLVLKAHWHAIGLADVNAIGAYGASAVKYRVDTFNILCTSKIDFEHLERRAINEIASRLSVVAIELVGNDISVVRQRHGIGNIGNGEEVMRILAALIGQEISAGIMNYRIGAVT